MKVSNIRKEFLNFFEEKGHQVIPSSKIFLLNDPTLLFVNAGMNVFKPIFLGQEPPSYARVANVQKCIRISGKHNDLSMVGVHHRHHTFFEMLGSWSFSDYSAKEAISWAFEFLVERMKIDEKKLYFTYYDEAPEIAEIWKSLYPHLSDHVFPRGKEDNFWEMGDQGPCGHCTEIYVDLGSSLCSCGHKSEKCQVGYCFRYLEVWNIVFMNYMKQADGTLTLLPNQYIDTGMGLERIASVLQGKLSNYEIDSFQVIIEAILRQTPVARDQFSEEQEISLRIIADHIRSIVVALSDGVLPSNEGRGYVIRKLIRRALVFGRNLEISGTFLATLVDPVISHFEGAYPDLEQNKKHIQNWIEKEEIQFSSTLDEGRKYFQKYTETLQKGEKIAGEVLFLLYDTYGFPLDMSEEMAIKQGFQVDREGFEQSMLLQKERSRKNLNIQKDSWADIPFVDVEEQNHLEEKGFVGYDQDQMKMRLISYAVIQEDVYLIFEATCFYPEGGGQIADLGILEADGVTLRVKDVQKVNGRIIHHTVVESGQFQAQTLFHGTIDRNRRQELRKHHTSVHMLFQALAHVLGKEPRQESAYVHPEYIRIGIALERALTPEEMSQVEEKMNEWIQENHPVQTTLATLEEAKQLGAVGDFYHKYGEKVRVVHVKDIALDICGGTHVSSTGELGSFVFTSQSSGGSGIRRLEASVGMSAYHQMQEYFHQGSQLSHQLGMPMKDISAYVVDLKKTIRLKEKEYQELLRSQQKSQELHFHSETMENYLFYSLQKFLEEEIDGRQILAQEVQKDAQGLFVILSRVNNKVLYFIGLGASLVDAVDTKLFIDAWNKEVSGRGGGRGNVFLGSFPDTQDSLLDIERKIKNCFEKNRKISP